MRLASDNLQDSETDNIRLTRHSERMIWFGDFQSVIGLPEKMDLEEKYGVA